MKRKHIRVKRMDHSLPKPCKTCGEVKSPAEFYSKSKNNPSVKIANCILCTKLNKKPRTPEQIERDKKKCKQWQLSNFEKVKEMNDRSSLKKFGITKEDFDIMNKSQNSLCAICKNPETIISNTSKLRQVNRLSVDHCHSSGKVRGLLCMACNVALGKFKDSIETLQSAIDYLKKNKP